VLDFDGTVIQQRSQCTNSRKNGRYDGPNYSCSKRKFRNYFRPLLQDNPARVAFMNDPLDSVQEFSPLDLNRFPPGSFRHKSPPSTASGA
jgi:hypothetical protein